MYYYEVSEIGRESVKSVSASILATLIKELVNKYEKNQNYKFMHRKYYVKCNEKLEFILKQKKIGDDEGFESDVNEDDFFFGNLSEDAQSTTSSCCLVEDNALKTIKAEINNQHIYERDPMSLVSIIGSVDSANSSGSSDTDDLEIHSLAPSPTNQPKKQSKPNRGSSLDITKNKKQRKNKKEEYSIGDVIFCHTEAKYPTVIAWVIKKQPSDTYYGSRLGITGVENFSKVENCLEIIVVKCKNTNNLKDLCNNYQEYSKRIKLDQYKTIKKKRNERQTSVIPTTAFSKDIKVSLSDMKVANSSLIKASELSILNPKIMSSFRNDLKTSVSLNSLIRPEHPISQNKKVDQDVRDVNQALHSNVKKTQSLMNLSKAWDHKCNTLSRNDGYMYKKNSVLKDHFNLIQTTDLNGVTLMEISKARDNKTDNEKFPSTKSKMKREIEGVILTDVESYAKKEQIRQRGGSENSGPGDTPPIRPERKKYLKKNTALTELRSEQKFTQSATKTPDPFFLSPQTNESFITNQRVIKGPYVKVQSWGSQNLIKPSLNTKTEPKEKHLSRYEDRFVERRRSKSAGRPPKRTPMAYRYIDIVNGNRGDSSITFGITQNLGVNTTDSMLNIRRRKSFDDIIALDNLKGNLKSVIKKNKKVNNKYCEPKKVTFSAFATVQVVE